MVLARVALAITREEAWCRLELRWPLEHEVINPRRACARVTVLVLSVCLSLCLCVCFPYSGTSRNHAYKQQYQRLQRDTGKIRFYAT